MITSYLRSSSYSNWDVCQQQYYINYVLGIPKSANLKADKGTIAHKVLEILAESKLELDKQTGSSVTFESDIGEVHFFKEEYLTPYHLTKKEVDTINKSRVDKKIYKEEHKLSYGHVRYGYDLVDSLIQRVFNQFTIKNPQHNWTNTDYKDCENFVWMALDYNNGTLDPRRLDIVSPEQKFDIEIDAKWAEFTHNGIKSKLRIKGTIDLITKIDDKTYQICDYKTGSRQNFATGEEKTHSKLHKDPQLMLYYYAARHLFPLVDNIVITIFFIRDGGPFTICFDDSTLIETESLLRNRIEEIWNNKEPNLISQDHSSFKCKYLCDYHKKNWDKTDKTICHFIQDKIKEVGIDETTEKFIHKDHCVDNYSDPGRM